MIDHSARAAWRTDEGLWSSRVVQSTDFKPCQYIIPWKFELMCMKKAVASSSKMVREKSTKMDEDKYNFHISVVDKTSRLIIDESTRKDQQ